VIRSQAHPLQRWGLLAAAGAGLLLPSWLGTVVALGRNIPQDDLLTDYARAVVWAVVLGAALALAPLERANRRVLLWLWAAKAAVTLGFELFYEAKYHILDSYFYFSESRYLDLSAGSFSFGDGTFNTISLTWLHDFLVPDSFHALKVTWAMIGLLAVYLFYRGFVLYLGREDRRLLVVLGLFPSVLFWSSTFGKDPLALLGIAVYTYGVIGWHRHRSNRWWWLVAAGVLLSAFIRLWLAPILLAPLLVLAFLGTRSPLTRSALVVLAVASLWLALRLLLARMGFASVQDVLDTVNTVSEAMTSGGAAQKLPTDLATPQGLLRFLPLGMFTALFRPLPGDVMNAFGLLAGLENLLLLVLLGLAIARTRWREVREPIIAWAVSLIVVWSGFYAFVSSFNLGGAVRFKLQVLPLMLALLLYFARRRAPSLPAA
jgi:hypothetical protein